jgi:glycosyltransferase involved in cell wall biosynthesis
MAGLGHVELNLNNQGGRSLTVVRVDAHDIHHSILESAHGSLTVPYCYVLGGPVAPRLRLMLVTPIMAPTRIPLFNALASDPTIDLTVVYLARTDPNRRWRFWEHDIAYRHEILTERFRWHRSDNYVHVSTGLLHALRCELPQVVIAGGWDQPMYHQALALRRHFRYAFVWWVESTLRDRRTERRWIRAAKKLLVDAADAIVVPGRASSDYVLALGAQPGRVFVAPNAVDNDFYRAAAVNRSDRSGRVRFLFSGRLEPAKGILYLLDAWNRMNADATLALAGHGSLELAVRARVISESMPAVETLGHLDRDDLVGEYRRADVFVFPTLSDPWGLAINEAMAAGLPVITTTAPGAVDDLVEHGSTGLVVEPASPDALLDALERLAAEPGLRLEMGSRSADKIAGFEPHAWADGVREAAYAAARRTARGNA